MPVVMAMPLPHSKSAYPDQRLSLWGVKSLHIVGVKGSLKLHGKNHGSYLNLKVQHANSRIFEDWQLSVDRRGNTLFLEVYNAASGKQWMNQVRAEFRPEFDIELSGPSLPTVVGWNEGKMEISHWNSDVEASILQGHVKVTGGSGALTLQSVNTGLTVRTHTGAIQIKGESGPIVLVGNHGALNLDWLRGPVSLWDCSGNMQIASQDSQVTVYGGGGELHLQLTKGLAKIDAFKGLVNGQSQQANWEISAAAPAVLNVTSKSGQVGLKWKTGGAKVFLTSRQGPIGFTPKTKFLTATDGDGRKIVEGVRTGQIMGQVFIRTESGAIGWSE